MRRFLRFSIIVFPITLALFSCNGFLITSSISDLSESILSSQGEDTSIDSSISETSLSESVSSVTSSSISLPTSHEGSSVVSIDGDFTLISYLDGYAVASYGGNATTVVIPSSYNEKSILAIGDYLFYENASILNVTFPDTIISIGLAAFKGCTQIYSIDLPANLLNIGTDAFSGCTGLSSVTFNNALQTIGNNAFENCPLSTIVLPASLTEIMSRSFADTALTRVDLLAEIPPLRTDNSFEGCPSSLIYHVPSSSLNAYQADAHWSGFASDIVSL